MLRPWIAALGLFAALFSREEPGVLHVYHPRSWYGDCLAGPAQTSSDGRFLLYSCEGRYLLADTQADTLDPLAERLGWDDVGYARFVPGGHRMFVRGPVEGQRIERIHDLDDGSFHEPGVPSNFELCFTSVAGRVVFVGPSGATWGLQVQDPGRDEPLLLLERQSPSGWAVSTDGSTLAWLALTSDGWSQLTLFDLADGSSRVVASGLDTSYQRTTLAWSPDDARIFLSLVGPEHETLADKQDPASERDLDIYALVVDTGELVPVVVGPGDDLVTGVTQAELLWTRLETSMRVGVVSIDGGEIVEIVGETASYPFWHPDGDRISAMFGAFHLADWALNWDLGVVSVDEDGLARGPLEPVVVGNHEDFALNWSPDGRWLAYHSHRSPEPAIAYAGNGATDDIWLRPAAGGPEFRLSRDPGAEVCQPEWSADGYELVFVAANASGRYRPVIIEIDPEEGTPVSQREFLPEGISGGVKSACYSPVAPEMALEEDVNGERRLWIVSLDGSGKRLLATYRSFTELSGCDFTPDGESVVYCALAGEHAQLFRVAAAGGEEPVQLTHDEEEKYAPQVSPDGERVAVTVYTHTKTVLSLPLEASDE